MKILMLVNWKIKYCDSKPHNMQPPDYNVRNEQYWFFRYFKDKPEVDVIDISSFSWLENFEKNRLHFYIWQALKAIPKLNKYNLIISHGMPSAVVICLWRRLKKTKAKHIVFDIGSFASASESGFALKLMQFASKSLDGLIYHMSSQRKYYEKFFPWIVDKSKFIRYGVDFEFFGIKEKKNIEKSYIVCAGKNKCDWNTVVKAYEKSNVDMELHLIGGKESCFENVTGVIQIPYLPIYDFIAQVQGAEFCILPLEPVPFSFGQMRLLQQMALKKCVIVSNAPSILDYVQDDYTALVYTAFDVESLKEKINYITNNEMIKNQISEKAYEFVKQECNERNMAEKIENYFSEVLGDCLCEKNKKGKI